MKCIRLVLVLTACAISGFASAQAQVLDSDAVGRTTTVPALQRAAGRPVNHDCAGMTGTALATCVELNRRTDEPARTGAGTTNDCSGLTGAPLLSCRRLNAANANAPRSGAGQSQDCGGQIADALVACRVLNGQREPADDAQQ